MGKKNYPTCEPGEIVPLVWRKEYIDMACCDCGLVHRYKFTVDGKLLGIQAWRHNRATGQLRRHMKSVTFGKK